jgi:hypothetical protein
MGYFVPWALQSLKDKFRYFDLANGIASCSMRFSFLKPIYSMVFIVNQRLNLREELMHWSYEL